MRRVSEAVGEQEKSPSAWVFRVCVRVCVYVGRRKIHEFVSLWPVGKLTRELQILELREVYGLLLARPLVQP